MPPWNCRHPYPNSCRKEWLCTLGRLGRRRGAQSYRLDLAVAHSNVQKKHARLGGLVRPLPFVVPPWNCGHPYPKSCSKEWWCPLSLLGRRRGTQSCRLEVMAKPYSEWAANPVRTLYREPGVRFCKTERYLWKLLWPKDISAGDIFGPESVSVKIYYGWNTCWATSPNPPGKISFRDYIIITSITSRSSYAGRLCLRRNKPLATVTSVTSIWHKRLWESKFYLKLT